MGCTLRTSGIFTDVVGESVGKSSRAEGSYLSVRYVRTQQTNGG